MRASTLFLAAAVVVAAIGCGGDANTPPLGEVTGHVTLNGEPLDGATVEFIPENGRPSIGLTDGGGNYSLQFRADTPGAVLGKHSVRITSQRSASGGEGGDEFVAARKETVPVQYNDETTLSVEVKSGSNKLDFPLEGKRSRRASAGA
ncbi:carboxypeptidase regulatory-like domain-containing protein [Blastopirellula sp. JC732]|uniref:Carboxypeptidase regulatory-like domain-containing protein n=1 Tax=Blastopirellula sediminis TaxID=2894196 RepID=A0A9X1SFD2_9BACT|nr:carboxypeptidase regulatory-like domain-containing protein [Blastopirellula sediminis]MCC9607806.1 carboxypeptidase regulatory-like domain-containing protein [Blastopirellula sediminis]MCC9627401.1 carboxypeptidase regulatory-like domain-containing protein [Blastopirellula sediminis]